MIYIEILAIFILPSENMFNLHRLVLTDATPAQLRSCTTSGNIWAPDMPNLGSISRAAFEI
ncbi:hypothetical protein I3842_16G087100 [Carya illinoinensis]|uniref:Uncharacterized protein n=1 Tax=Carya illinoinensis TaxID=32201 RepID=A0A922D5Y5_CARIL|nr:hypothetical protein I3842_16G087100 [Carya illinoinensis]